MTDEQQPNPFEEHINSEYFDVSRLDSSLISGEMDPELQQFFDSLPYPLNHTVWENALDDRQRTICAHVTLELVDRVMRVHFGDKVRHLRDDELIYLLTVPVAVAMLAEQQLHQQPAAQTAHSEALQSSLQHPAAAPIDVPEWGVLLNHWLLRVRDFVVRVIRRRN